MQRDRDEWRRPWTPAVAAPLPTLASEPRDEVGFDLRDVPADARTMTPDPVRSPVPTLPPPGVPAAPRRTGPRRILAAATLVAVALAGGAAGATLTLARVGPLGSTSPEPSGVDAPVRDTSLPNVDPTRDVIPQVAEIVTPSVVRIDVRGAADSGQQALGSGVILRADGYIITNHHVIENASGITVRLASGDLLDAELIGSDVLNDLAVLRIARDGLPAIRFRPDAEALRVGETVVAIGSPFGLDASVTAGIISALNRDLRLPGNGTIPAVLQTDAAINPGNSGGALVDLQGRLIGINTAIMSRTGSNEGIGFAVPAQQALSSSEQLIRQGFVRYPLLGITGTDVSAEVAQAFGLPNRRGAVVESVQAGSGAAEAGMLPGDIIVAVDGVELTSMSQLVAEVRRRMPGDRLVIVVVRDGVRLTLEAVLGERPRD